MRANSFFAGMEEQLAKAVESGLEGLGAKVADEIKSQLQKGDRDGPHIASKQLYDSITWATSKAVDRSKIGPSAQSEDVIDKPSEPGMLHIGTKAPQAWYLEKGTSPHTARGEMSQQYEDRIHEWALSKGITSEEEIENIIFAIRKRGTTKHPFVQPVKDDLEQNGIVVKTLSDIVNTAMRNFSKNWKDVVIPMEIKL
jgi:hypothetical protein